MSARQHSGGDDGDGAATRCLAPDDVAALRALRDEVFELVGPGYGFGILYGSGFREGMLQGLRLARGFQGIGPPAPQPSGPGIHLLFCPAGDGPAIRFGGVLARSLEASLPASDVPPEAQPGCVVSASFAAGWYSAVLGEELLVREVECTARGDAACRFEASSAAEWKVLDPAWADRLLPFLDFDKIRQRVSSELEQLEVEPCGPDEATHFDPLTPAAHVWGPLLVLPYAGVEDANSTLASIWSDSVSERLEVAVIDVTGAHVDEVEAIGLVQLLSTLEECGIEPILAGIQPRALSLLQRADSGKLEPLVARDVPDAIALAFQLCQPSERVH